jgi:hypothetical protein
LEKATQKSNPQTTSLKHDMEAEPSRAADLEAELARLRKRANELERAIRQSSQQIKSLRTSLETERTRTANLQRTLWAERAKKVHIQQRNRELGEELATPAITRALRLLRQKGDQITGGGLRSLTKGTFRKAARRAIQQPHILAVARKILRPFPKLTASLYEMATKPDEFPQASPPSDGAVMIGALPASARKIYSTLRSLILEVEVTEGGTAGPKATGSRHYF